MDYSLLIVHNIQNRITERIRVFVFLYVGIHCIVNLTKCRIDFVKIKSISIAWYAINAEFCLFSSFLWSYDEPFF